MSARTIGSGVLALAVLCAVADVSADFRVERRLALAPGSTFILEATGGSVVVTGDAPSGAVVTVTSADDSFGDRFAIEVEQRPGFVRMTVRRRGGWLSGWVREGLFGRPGAQFTVRLPRDTRADISTSGGSIDGSRLSGASRLRTSGGGIRARDISGPLDARTSGGSIDARNIAGDVIAGTSGGGIAVADIRGSARAETSGGAIQIDGVAGNIYAGTSGGGVRVRGAGGRIEAHSSGGPITVSFAPSNGRGGDLSTSGGSVVAEVDPKVALSIDAATSGGDVRSEVPLLTRGTTSQRALRGDLNGGGPLLRLRTSGGGVRIAAAP